MKRRDIIRVDDRVEIVVPKFVTRVGYPRDVKSYEPDVKERFGTALNSIFTGRWSTHRTRIKVERELAYMLAQQDHFGGCERSLHLADMPEMQGQKVRVLSIRTAVTGRYFPPSRSHDYYGDGDEPGGLAGEKHHRIATINSFGPAGVWHRLEDGMLEIPVEHLKKVEGL